MTLQELPKHPYGMAFFHQPTGKVVYLQNRYEDGSYSAHFQYQESLIVKIEDLRFALKNEVEKFYSHKVL